ncbi:ABC-three component system protein [Vibrio jasicida]|uniref:ABC-three component system protein n=1 Tax=Vibrio jasicida TaxID=766224 RepID=UPI000399C67F|nr:ABC-three component system protein [Vibrio jasicida]
MEKKINLKKADEYEYRVAALHAIKALDKYLEGEPHCQRIGSEQGDIPEWDDIVLYGEQTSCTHYQVKRQTQDFCKRKLTRGTFTNQKNDNKPTLQEQSVLDKAFESLGNYFSDPAKKPFDKTFTLIIPNAGVLVKKDLYISQIREVLTSCHKAGSTLESFEKEKGSAEKLREWLKSWCNFKNNETIYNCLSRLTIEIEDCNEELDRKCTDILSRWYNDEGTVFEKIRCFLVKNASSTQTITPRMLANHVDSFFKPQADTWAYYEKSNMRKWAIAGTLSGHLEQVEPAKIVVDKLWGPLKGRYELQLSEYNTGESCNLSLSLARLAIHAKNSVSIAHNNPAGWTAYITSKLLKTFGTSDCDVDKQLAIEKRKKSQVTDHRELSSSSKIKEESKELSNSMDQKTWELVQQKVNSLIVNMEPGDVQDAVEEMWNAWEIDLQSNTGLQSNVLSGMLYATSEGDITLGTLRAGPVTVSLIGEALHFLLLIAVGLEDKPIEITAFEEKYSVKTIALAFWSGPATKVTTPRQFFLRETQEERAQLLGQETSKLLLLPQTSAPKSYIERASLAYCKGAGENIAVSRTPNTVITRTHDLQDIIESNDIESLRNFIQQEINFRDEQREKQIKDLTQRV